MNNATRSVSMWPASASSAIEPMTIAVVTSIAKNAPRMTAARTIRLVSAAP